MAVAAGLLASVVLALQVNAFGWSDVPNTYPNISACVSQPLTYSCENTTAIADTCCSPTPGGLVLQTQFWDTYTGLELEGQLLPKDSWTIHGLWPDNCDGYVLLILQLATENEGKSPGHIPSTVTSVASTIRTLALLSCRMAQLCQSTMGLPWILSSSTLSGLTSWTTVRIHASYHLPLLTRRCQ